MAQRSPRTRGEEFSGPAGSLTGGLGPGGYDAQGGYPVGFPGTPRNRVYVEQPPAFRQDPKPADGEDPIK